MKIDFERWGETILGAVVAFVAIGFFVFAAAQAGKTGGRDGYELTANFHRVDGINIGSDVRMAGVKIGAVRTVALDPATFEAVLTLSIDNNVEVLDESTARVASDGLLGGAYISIEPAGMAPLARGDRILYTQGSVDLLTLFAGFANQSRDQNSE